MNLYKNYNLFISETKITDLSGEKLESDALSFKDWIEEWLGQEKIEKRPDIIKEVIDNKGKSIIKGFVTDNDKFDLYIKFTDDIDRLLKDKFITQSPEEIGIDSLYGFIIKGIEYALCKELKKL